MAEAFGARAPLQFVRFIAAGLLNTAFGYTVFVVLIWAGMGSLAALVLATAAGVLFNFQTSRALVFRDQRAGMLRFASVYIVMIGVNWAALSALERLGLQPWAAQGVLTLPLALLSFAAQKFLVFGARMVTA